MSEALYAGFPDGFFDRQDTSADAEFYRTARLVAHLDDGAIAAVGDLYAELGIDGDSEHPVRVLDLMSSWISHFRRPPAELVALGMNAQELHANTAATGTVVHDLNDDPVLPFADADFDAVTCCVSIDYLVRPVEVLVEVGRVLRPGGVVAITFSNRCFPTKAVRGWLDTDDRAHCTLVGELLRRAGAFSEPVASLRTRSGDPLYAVTATRLA